jgi:hypothetical protein
MESPLSIPAPLPSPAYRQRLAASRPFAASRETLLIRSLISQRPCAPLSKSFRINTVTKLPRKAPMSNSFRFNYFQTSCKAPLSKSFRMIALRKDGGGGLTTSKLPTFDCQLATIQHSPNPQCFLSLTKNHKNALKIPQCFLSLTSFLSRKSLCFLSLPKKGGGGGVWC